jgi:Tol biopolymer transport system component
MRLLLTSVLLLCWNWVPQQRINSETCQNVLVYSALTDTGLRYYEFDVSQQHEIELPFDNLVSEPVWSPDGNYIAIATNNGGDGFDLAVVSDIYAEPVPIASGHATQPKIRWSPNGEWIAFESENNIYAVTRTGDEYRQLTQGNQVYYLGDWSPDGRYLAISAYDIEGQNLLVAALTEDLQEITSPVESIFDYFVGWTPNSEGILYSTNRFSDQMALYRFDLRDETSESIIDAFDDGF